MPATAGRILTLLRCQGSARPTVGIVASLTASARGGEQSRKHSGKGAAPVRKPAASLPNGRGSKRFRFHLRRDQTARKNPDCFATFPSELSGPKKNGRYRDRTCDPQLVERTMPNPETASSCDSQNNLHPVSRFARGCEAWPRNADIYRRSIGFSVFLRTQGTARQPAPRSGLEARRSCSCRPRGAMVTSAMQMIVRRPYQSADRSFATSASPGRRRHGWLLLLRRRTKWLELRRS